MTDAILIYFYVCVGGINSEQVSISFTFNGISEVKISLWWWKNHQMNYIRIFTGYLGKPELLTEEGF